MPEKFNFTYEPDDTTKWTVEAFINRTGKRFEIKSVIENNSQVSRTEWINEVNSIYQKLFEERF